MAWPNTVRKADLRIDYYRGSGAGGQHRNKTDSACRIVHIPTGIMATAEDERHQSMNRQLAFKRLTKKLIPLMKQEPKKLKCSNETIRTYHEPRNSVKDHRTGETYSYNEVIHKKGLCKVIKDMVPIA